MGKFRRGTYKTKTAPKSWHNKLKDFPNFSVTGSITGMKNLYYGLDAKLIRCGAWIYNVSSQPDLYDQLP